MREELPASWPRLSVCLSVSGGCHQTPCSVPPTRLIYAPKFSDALNTPSSCAMCSGVQGPAVLTDLPSGGMSFKLRDNAFVPHPL
jgi:hypothetical protein